MLEFPNTEVSLETSLSQSWNNVCLSIVENESGECRVWSSQFKHSCYILGS